MRGRTSGRPFVALAAFGAAALLPAGADSGEMAELAASMKAGEWAELKTDGLGMKVFSDGGHHALQYTDEAVWDPVSRQLFFCGEGHGAAPRFVKYTEGTNRWTVLPLPGFGPVHAYDHQAIDPLAGIFYRGRYYSREIQRYDIREGTWNKLTEIPAGSGLGGSRITFGFEYFPEMRSLVVFLAAGGLYLYDIPKGEWRQPAGKLGEYAYHEIARYNPVHKVVVFGGGNDSKGYRSKDLWKLDASGEITKLREAPLPIGVTSTIFTVDPVSGQYLVFGREKEVYEYDVTTDTWTERKGEQPPIFTFGPDLKGSAVFGCVATPASDHGVVMFVKYDGDRSKVFLYKHAAPAAPPDLRATDWPCFHGRNRENRPTETGLLTAWPPDGPERIWTAEGLGRGYSSVAVSGDRIFTAGMVDKTTHVIALDRTSGTILWRKSNGPSWEASREQPWAISYAGSRGTPTVDGDTVYHLAEMGDLRAFDAKTGAVIWHVDLLRVFAAGRPKYGLSESVLILGDSLFCCPGGTKGYMVALNKRDGKTLWANTDIGDPVGYDSPVPASIGGVEQVIAMSAKRVFAVKPDDGALLWEYAFGNDSGNSATDVIVHDDRVFASCGYGKGCVLLHPQRQAGDRFTVEEVWSSPLLDNHHGGVLRVGDHVYGAGHEERGWFCLEFSTGKLLWRQPGKGTLTFADGHLYCMDEKGTLSLVRCSPERWDVACSFRLPSDGRGLHWAHPVVCDGRLYVRHEERLLAYRIRPQ